MAAQARDLHPLARAPRDDFLCLWVRAYRWDRKHRGKYFVKLNHTRPDGSHHDPCAAYTRRRDADPPRPPPLVPADPRVGIVPFAELIF